MSSQSQRERLRVNISTNDNNLNLTIESKEDLNLAIETLELMYKKTGVVTVPATTEAQFEALGMITPIGTP